MVGREETPIALSITDLDALLKYDPETHSVSGMPSLMQPTPENARRNDLSALVGMSGETTAHPAPRGIPSVGEAPAPEIAAPAPAGIPSLEREGIPSLQPPKSERGFWGKLGHGLATAGNVAGNIVAPGTMELIPGTQLHKEFEEARGSQLAGEKSAQDLQGAEAANLRSEIEKRNQPAQRMKPFGEPKQDPISGQWVQGMEKTDPVTGEVSMSFEPVAGGPAARPAAPQIEKASNGDIVQLSPDAQGNMTSKVVYKADPKVETDLVPRTINGQPHTMLVNKQTGEDIKDLGAHEKEASPAADLAKMKGNEEPVIGYDKDGNQKLVSRGEAKETGLTHIIKASDKDRNDAEQNTSVLNDMGAKVRNLMVSRDALNQGAYEKSLIATALKHGPDSYLTAGAVGMMSEKSKAYVQDVFSLREAALALPKQLTGGSRVSEIQAQALWQTIPGISGDDKYAEQQLRKFDENLGRLWKKVPLVEGNQPERAFPPENKAGGGNEPTRPANVPAGYEFNASGPKGAGWYKPQGK